MTQPGQVNQLRGIVENRGWVTEIQHNITLRVRRENKERRQQVLFLFLCGNDQRHFLCAKVKFLFYYGWSSSRVLGLGRKRGMSWKKRLDKLLQRYIIKGRNYEGNHSGKPNKILWTMRGWELDQFLNRRTALEIVELNLELSGRVGLMNPLLIASVGSWTVIADHLIKSLGCVNKKYMDASKSVVQ